MRRSVLFLATWLACDPSPSPHLPSNGMKPRGGADYHPMTPHYCDPEGLGKVPNLRWAADCEERCAPLRTYGALCHGGLPPHVVLTDGPPETWAGGTFGKAWVSKVCGGAGGWRVFRTAFDRDVAGNQRIREDVDGAVGLSWRAPALDDCATKLDAPSTSWAQDHPWVYPYRTAGWGNDDGSSEILPE